MSPSARPGEFVPFALPDITDSEIQAVTRVLRSGWLSTGPEVRAFEQEFAAALGVGHAVALNSCTAALHLALEAIGLRPGDIVLTSTLTFTATAEVVEYFGASTQFLDVDEESLAIRPDQVAAALRRDFRRKDGRWISRRTGGRLRAVVPVHFGGVLCDMRGFSALAAEHEFALVDDAAHAFPASRDGQGVGTFGCPTAFSFYATKTLSTGEGGMLTTDSEPVADRVRLMALHGISRDAWKRYSAEGSWSYEVVEAGFKYNLTDIAAALGRVQLARAQAMLERRAHIAATYGERLAELPLDLPRVAPQCTSAWHLYPVRLQLEHLSIDRAQFIEELRALGVGASVHFIPLHQQPFYRDRYAYRSSDFPVAESVYPRLVSLPIYSRMGAREVERVVEAVREICARHPR